MRDVLKNRGGQALVPVLMVMALLLVLTASLGTITAHTGNNMVREHLHTRALYAADAGMEKTGAKIKSNPLWYRGLTDDFEDVFDQGEISLSENTTFSARIKRIANEDQILGTAALVETVGRYKNNVEVLAQKTLRSNMAVYEARDYFKGFSVLSESTAEVEINGNATLYAPVFFSGRLGTGDGINVAGGNPVHTIRNCRYIPPFPALKSGYYRELAEQYGPGREYNSGPPNPVFDFPNSHIDTRIITIQTGEDETWECTVPLYSGYYFVNGSVRISGEYQGNAVMFATGDISVAGDLQPLGGDLDIDPDSGFLTLIAHGNVNIENSNVYANLMSAGSFRTSGSVELHGAVCAAGVEMAGGRGNNFIMYYEAGRAPDRDAVPLTIKTLDWKELYPVF